MSRFRVRTRDVDGSTSSRFKSFAGARKRFESMLGLTMEQAIDEYFWANPVKPTAEAAMFIKGVSMYGTVVYFERLDARL